MVELIIGALADLIAEGMQGMAEVLLPLVSFDFNAFVTAFPFVVSAYPVIQGIALGIALIIAALELIIFISPLSSSSKSSPFRIIGFTIFSIAGIYYGNYLLSGIMQIMQAPYNVLLNMDATTEGPFGDVMASVGGISSAIEDGLATISILLYLVVIILIAVAFIKLLLEMFERYAILFGLLFLSPLAASTLASESTSGVAKKFLVMFISQSILMVLNVWAIKMVISNLDNLSNMPDIGGKMLNLLLVYAVLRLAARFDSYLNQLGLNAAVTGMGIGGELMGAGMLLASRMGGSFGFGRGGAGAVAGGHGGVAGTILGATKSVGQAITKASPLGGLARAGMNAAGAAFQTAKAGVSEGFSAMKGVSGIDNKIRAAFSAGTAAMKDKGGKNFSAAWQKTQGESLWARAVPNAEVDQAKAAAFNGDPLSQNQMDILANNGYVADQAYASFTAGTETNDENAVSAIMQGIGLERADPAAKDAIDVGYGNLNAENPSYVLGSDGLQASYMKDGKQETWNVVNSEQYGQLSAQEQRMYTQFRSDNGTPYFYSHVTSRAPSAQQMERDALDQRIDQFAQNPSGNGFTQQEFATLARYPDGVNSTFQAMAQQGTSTSDPQQVSGILDAVRFPGYTSAKNQATMHLADGTAKGTLDGSGATVSWTDSAGKHELSYLRENEGGGATYHGRDVSAGDLTDMGFTKINSNGQTYYAGYQGPKMSGEEINSAIRDFGADPAGHPLSPRACYGIGKDSAYVSTIFDSLAQHGTSVDYSEETKSMMADLMSAMRFPDGIPVREQSEAAMRLAGDGGPVEARMSGNGMVVRWESDAGAQKQIALLTEAGLGLNGYDVESAGNLGMRRLNLNGTTVYGIFTTENPNKVNDAISRGLTNLNV